MPTRRAASRGILAGPIDGPARTTASPTPPSVEATPGLALVHRASGFRGALVRMEAGGVELRGATGLVKVFRDTPGAFLLDGRPVTLRRPAAPPSDRRSAVTASGSRSAPEAPARVARGARLWVEGVHDAELVERVWGDDLRVEGVVVERLDGIDHLAAAVRAFGPGPARRLGVLVDHLVPGSKESRLAAAVDHPHVLVTGTPFVDVWEAVRPSVLGIPAWPTVPRGTDWKTGVCAALGLGEPPGAWRRILGSVSTYADLEPALVGAVERLIDFVTDEG